MKVYGNATAMIAAERLVQLTDFPSVIDAREFVALSPFAHASQQRVLFKHS